MKRLMKLIEVLVIGAVLPILLFLAIWWASLSFFQDQRVFVLGLIGLGIGIVLDFTLLRKWLQDFNCIPVWMLAAIYLFYSICTLGFFMGVPVFNLLPGMLAGYFMGKRLLWRHADIESAVGAIKKIALFTGFTMVAVSLGSAWIALKDPADTARNLEGMLNLKSMVITLPVLLGIIVIGGALLIAAQYFSTKLIASWTYHHFKTSQSIMQ